MVVGMARSGISSARLLLKVGAFVMLYDKRTSDEVELGGLPEQCEDWMGKDPMEMCIRDREKFVGKLTTLPLADRRAQSFFRLLCASATECDTDKQGRVVIPQRLREYAGLEKDVLVNGVVNRAEIWSKENWDDFSEAANDGFEETLEKLMELGI